jgi:hypothetical protein
MIIESAAFRSMGVPISCKMTNCQVFFDDFFQFLEETSIRCHNTTLSSKYTDPVS